MILDLSKVNTVISYFSDIADEMIKDVFLFDFYKNKKTNSVKIGYRLIFQSNVKTLSDDEITFKVNKILKPILSMEGVSIPGM